MDLLYFFGLLNVNDSLLDVSNKRLERMFGWSSPETDSIIARQRMRVRLLKYAHDTDRKTLERLSSNRRMFALARGIEVKGTRRGSGLPFPSEQDIVFNITIENVSDAAIEMTSHMTKKIFIIPMTKSAASENTFCLDTYLPLCLMRRISVVVKYAPIGNQIPVLKYDGLIFEDRPFVDYTPDSRSTLVNAPVPSVGDFDSEDPDTLAATALAAIPRPRPDMSEFHFPAEYSSIDVSGESLPKIRASEPLTFEVNGLRYMIKDHDIRSIRPRSLYG